MTQGTKELIKLPLSVCILINTRFQVLNFLGPQEFQCKNVARQEKGYLKIDIAIVLDGLR